MVRFMTNTCQTFLLKRRDKLKIIQEKNFEQGTKASTGTQHKIKSTKKSTCNLNVIMAQKYL